MREHLFIKGNVVQFLRRTKREREKKDERVLNLDFDIDFCYRIYNLVVTIYYNLQVMSLCVDSLANTLTILYELT